VQIRAESVNAPKLHNNAPATQINPSIPPNHECMENYVSISKGRSMIHHHIQAKKTVFILFDIDRWRAY